MATYSATYKEPAFDSTAAKEYTSTMPFKYIGFAIFKEQSFGQQNQGSSGPAQFWS